MDPTLWNSLPTVLIELVLAKLPFLTLVRMRLVCKSWNSLILEEGFAPPNPNPKSLILHGFPIYEHGDKYGGKYDNRPNYRPSLIAYDTVKVGWFKLLLKFPREVLSEILPLPRLAATGGGLLCFKVSSPIENTFIICNPVTTKWKRLPCMELHPWLSSSTSITWRVVGLAYDEICKNYKLVVAGYCLEEAGEYVVETYSVLKGTQVYDSVTESWTLTLQDTDIREPSGGINNALNKSLFCSKSLFWNSHLFVLTGGDDYQRDDLIIFSMKKGTWIQILAFEYTQHEDPAYLLLHQDQVLVVGEELPEGRAQTIDFWKLNIPDLEAMWSPDPTDPWHLWVNHWVKLKFVEKEQLPQFTVNSSRSLNWACMGHRDVTSFVFCRNTSKKPTHSFYVHDLVKDSWNPLPSTRHLKVGDPCDSCAFEPSLSLP